MWGIVGLVVLLVAILGVVRLLLAAAPLPAGISVGSLLALLGGTLAFLAVMIQIEVQQNAREEERTRETRAIVVSLLAEVTDFRKFHLDKVGKPPSPGSKVKFLDVTFAVYQGNVAKMGRLQEQTCRAVVHFYDIAMEYLAALRRYGEIIGNRPLAEDYEGTEYLSARGKEATAVINRDMRASEFFKHSIKDALPKINEAAAAAEQMLQLELQCCLGCSVHT
ncbi:MAG TPA: hypothetical protein VNJ52_01045 [Patescibacteria group bacterium]|nr:hypothetical protein [Patescibacteria group bacterium]